MNQEHRFVESTQTNARRLSAIALPVAERQGYHHCIAVKEGGIVRSQKRAVQSAKWKRGWFVSHLVRSSLFTLHLPSPCPPVLLTFRFFACREDLWWRFSGVRTSEESLSGVASAQWHLL